MHIQCEKSLPVYRPSKSLIEHFALSLHLNILVHILASLGSNIESMLDNLQEALEKMFHWFSANHLVGNEGKCHLLTSSKTPEDAHISNTEILN